MYICCLVTVLQALLSLGSDGYVQVVPRYLFIIIIAFVCWCPDNLDLA